MGTSAVTIVKIGDRNSETLVSIYRQCDGYPSYHGKELKKFANTKIVNGIGMDQGAPEFANGMECLAAQMVKEWKTIIGHIYLVPEQTGDYTYTVYQGNGGLHVELKGYDEIFFDGPLSKMPTEG